MSADGLEAVSVSKSHADFRQVSPDRWRAARPNDEAMAWLGRELVRRRARSPELDATLDLVAARGEQALRALAVGRWDEAAEAAQAVAGLGVGLTPAGDDYLVGAFYALRLGARRQSIAGLDVSLGALASGVAVRTTTRSAEWLAAAGRGEAAPGWRGLLAAMASGDRGSLCAALREVLATGHTSGAVSLAGLLDQLALLESMPPESTD